MTEITKNRGFSWIFACALVVAVASISCAAGGDGKSEEELCAVCADNATCDIATGEAVCTCPAGYQDIAGNGSDCPDIDECATNNHDCDERAECINNDGGFTCLCLDGYTGDGRECGDIDECQLDDTCDANATCTNYDGTFTCECDEGYEGDGIDCADVDECMLQTDECHPDAICQNVVGGYECACDEGFTGDGFNCSDLDECFLGTDSCAGLTVCSNLPGSYECVCPPGYLDEFGDSSSCLLGAAGRVHLIGHDFFISNEDNNRLLGNAVFSANTTGNVEILAYNEFADNSAGQEVGSINAAVNARAAELGVGFTLSTFNDYTQLSNLLVGKHVLLIYEQESASAVQMINIGQAWELTLRAFVADGGVVVVTDFDGSTWQILNRSGLMNIASTGTIVSGNTLTLDEPGHALGASVGNAYTATTGTRYYNSDNAVPIVTDAAGRAVVLSRSQRNECVTVDDFESGVWPNSRWRAPSGSSAGSLLAQAAHDFGWGLRDPNWHYQVDVTAGEVGERVRMWVRLSQLFSEVSMGFGSGEWGTFSVTLSYFTSQLVVQNNVDYVSSSTLQTQSFVPEANKWYLLEVQFAGSDLVTVRMYEELNAVPLAAMTATVPGLRPGGLALRSYAVTDIDSPEVCPPP